MDAVLTGLIGTLVGVLIGNRLALARDKRKEFNEVATPLFENLERQRIDVEKGNFPSAINILNEDSFIGLIRVSPFYRKSALKTAIRDYNSAKANCGIFVDGIYQLNQPKMLLNAIEALQKFMQHA